jgi:hypothetical protein
MTGNPARPVEMPPPQATSLVNPTNTIAYIMAGIVIVSTLLSVGIVAIVVFGPGEDQTKNIGALVGAVSPVLIGLVGFLVTKKVDAVHVQINERMTQLLQRTEEAARLAGEAAALKDSAVRAADVATTTAEITAEKAVVDQAAAEARAPHDRWPA